MGTQSRKYKFTGKVFKCDDLIRIARVLDNQEMPMATDHYAHVRKVYSVAFDDGTTVENESIELLCEQDLIRPARPIVITMNYVNWDRKSIDINLSHGDRDYGRNFLSVSGADPQWVASTFLQAKEAIDASDNQNTWVNDHPNLTACSTALAIGAAIFSIAAGAVAGVSGFYLSLLSNMAEKIGAPLSYGFGLFMVVALGSLCGGHWLHRWLKTLWPSVEFAFGGEQRRIEAIRRRRVGQILPLSLAVFFKKS